MSEGTVVENAQVEITALKSRLEYLERMFESKNDERFSYIDTLLENRMKEIMALDKRQEANDAAIAYLKNMSSINSPMSLMNDEWIISRCMHQDSPDKAWTPKSPEHSMIFPFVPAHVSKIPVQVFSSGDDAPIESFEKRISYGLSSFGYDVTLAPKFKMFSPIPKDGGPYLVIDPKNFDSRCFVEVETDVVILPPSSFMLAVTNEYIRMPRDAVAICFNKSTYARCGINVATTVMEPGWTGQIVLEIANTTPIPAKIYANEGIAQLMFFRGNAPIVDYAQRNGKYMDQRGVVTAK